MIADLQSLPRLFNELLILSALGRGSRHGYQVAVDVEEESNGYFSFNHGTLYPILHHLEKQGLIHGTWDTSAGRPRKEYVLTDAGRAHLRTRIGEWKELDARLSAIIRERPPIRSRPAANQ